MRCNFKNVEWLLDHERNHFVEMSISIECMVAGWMNVNCIKRVIKTKRVIDLKIKSLQKF